jgi:transposase
MPSSRLAHFVLLPELELKKVENSDWITLALHARKASELEVCPKCATPSRSIYDHRKVIIKDAPLRNRRVRLIVSKRRFYCRPCRKPFTEPIPGVSKGRRYSQRFKEQLLWACETFADLKSVRRQFDCSYGFVYKALYEMLERKARHRCPIWPPIMGIDEHYFGRSKPGGWQEFATLIVNHRTRKAFEVVKGRSPGELKAALGGLPGRENVQFVTMDLSTGYRSFAREFFPQAQIVADKFHVVRLLNHAINRRRKEITGDKRSLPVRRLLLCNGSKLSFPMRSLLWRWLESYPALREVYFFKEELHRLYRTRGYNRASRAMTRLLDAMGRSALPEILSLRRTLLSWRREILCYFKTGLTNGRVEGFNNVAKVMKKQAYGYRSFENYRLRLLNRCC